MEINEIQELLNSEEVKTVLSEKFVPKEEVNGLVRNKDAILEEKRKLKEQLDSLLPAVDKITSDGYNSIEEAFEELKRYKSKTIENAESNSDVEKLKEVYSNDLQVQERKYQTKLSKLESEKTSRITELEDTINSLSKGWNNEKIDNTFNSEFDRIKVLPEYKSVLRDALHGRASVEENDEGKRIVFLTSADGLKQPANEYFEQWKDTEQGKYFIEAPRSAGGGAAGNRAGQRPGTLATAQDRYKNAKNVVDKVGAIMDMTAAKKR